MGGRCSGQSVAPGGSSSPRRGARWGQARANGLRAGERGGADGRGARARDTARACDVSHVGRRAVVVVRGQVLGGKFQFSFCERCFNAGR